MSSAPALQLPAFRLLSRQELHTPTRTLLTTLHPLVNLPEATYQALLYRARALLAPKILRPTQPILSPIAILTPFLLTQ